MAKGRKFKNDEGKKSFSSPVKQQKDTEKTKGDFSLFIKKQLEKEGGRPEKKTEFRSDRVTKNFSKKEAELPDESRYGKQNKERSTPEKGDFSGSDKSFDKKRGGDDNTRPERKKYNEGKAGFVKKSSEFSKKKPLPFGKDKPFDRAKAWGNDIDKPDYGKEEGGSPFQRPEYKDRAFDRKDDRGEKRSFHKHDDRKSKRKHEGKKSSGRKNREEEDHSENILRLNKFVAQTGLCSRRKAAELIKKGELEVNGVVEINPAYEIKPKDVISHKGKIIKKEEKLVYLLMNKPKNTITSSHDEKGRRTVIELVKGFDDVRFFPVGRLDRNTTGLLLLTNDGELASKLSHPSFKVKKFYHVILDKNLKPSDLDDIRRGLVLDDGPAEVDAVEYIKGATHNEIGIEIHIGKNRIVRRIFEHLGYEVIKLDRTYYAGLTKKDLPRGFTRELSDQEVIMLKHFTKGK